MKKYSKRLFAGLMVTLLLGGNLISSVGAYAETVLEEPKTGETTSGESSTPPNEEKETSLPGLQDNLPKPAESSTTEPSQVKLPTEAPKTEEPKVDPKAEVNPKEDPAKETESEDGEELPQLSNLEAGNSPEAPVDGSGEIEGLLYEDYIGSSHIWIGRTYPSGTFTLHIDAGDFNDDTTHAPWNGDWPFNDRQLIDKIKIEGPLILPRNAQAIFSYFEKAKVLEGANYLDSSRVENMADMFSRSGFEKLDLSSFDTSNVGVMYGMFREDTFLTEVNVSSFKTKNVVEFSLMFLNTKITSLDLSPFALDGPGINANGFLGGVNTLTKIILGPDTRLVPTMALTTEPRMAWFNTSGFVKPMDSIELMNTYNSNAAKFSGTYELRPIGQRYIITKDLTLYKDDPNVEKRPENWEPQNNFVAAYTINGDSVPLEAMSVDTSEYENALLSNEVGTYSVKYSYLDIVVEAKITIKKATEKPVTVHVNYTDFYKNVFKTTTVKTTFGKAFNFMEDFKDPYMYTISSVDLTNNQEELDVVPKEFLGNVKYIPYADPNKAYAYLAYLPSWEEDQTITVLLGFNAYTPTIEVNPLTFNLGQRLPDSLNKAIKSIKLGWGTDEVFVRRFDKDNHFIVSESCFYPKNSEKPPAADLSKLFEFTSFVSPIYDQSDFTSTVGVKPLHAVVTINPYASYIRTPAHPLFDEFKQNYFVDIPVTVQMPNNYIELYGDAWHLTSRIVLDDSIGKDTFDVNAVLGESDPNKRIHPIGGVYHGIGFQSSSGNAPLNITSDLDASFPGSTLAKQEVEAIGTHTFKKSDTTIMKIYHYEGLSYPELFKRILNGKVGHVSTAYTPKFINKQVLFEIVPGTGFLILTLNQLTPKNNQSIFKNASHAYLDAHVKEFIDSDKYPGLTVSWSEYPDTSTEGAKPGKLLVTQKSSTKKDLTYEYPVSVTIVPGSVQLSVSDIAHFDDITIDGKAKVIQSSDFTAKIIDTASVSEPLHGRHYSITASIANKNESLAPYLSYVTEYEIEKPGNFPDFEDIETEEERNNLLVKTLPKIIDTLNFHGFFSNDNPDEPIELNLWTFSPHSHPLFDEDSTTKEMNGLFLAIPANAPLKQGTYSATISWDIANVP